MSKKRYINTKFWSDSFIIELKPLERYLFLYFLTNEHTDICGIYELPLIVIERETGIDYDSLLKIINRLKGKIYLIEKNWIYIKNFSKHQASNPKVEEGIKRSFNEIPIKIREKVKEIDIEYNSLSIEYEQLKLKPKLKPLETTKVVAEQSSAVNEIFKKFYEINPGLNFGNKTQREAANYLIKKFGSDCLIGMINWYISRMQDKYCPVATTPLAFKEKLGDIKNYADKLKNNQMVTNLGNV